MAGEVSYVFTIACTGAASALDRLRQRCPAYLLPPAVGALTGALGLLVPEVWMGGRKTQQSPSSIFCHSCCWLTPLQMHPPAQKRIVRKHPSKIMHDVSPPDSGHMFLAQRADDQSLMASWLVCSGEVEDLKFTKILFFVRRRASL